MLIIVGYSMHHEKVEKDGGVVVHGMEVPHHVVIALKELGIPLEQYHTDELRMAIQACVDGHLIEDKNGINFKDKLVLTTTEKQKAEEEEEVDEPSCEEHKWSKVCGKKHKPVSYTAKIKEEREHTTLHEHVHPQ